MTAPLRRRSATARSRYRQQANASRHEIERRCSVRLALVAGITEPTEPMERDRARQCVTGLTLAGLGVTRQTLYRFVGPKGELRADGNKLLKSKLKHGRS